MSLELWLAYCGYLVWLSAGLGDFLIHRRTDLPHTSGVAESAAHLVQLAILGVAVLIGLGFEAGRTSTLLIAGLVAAHAVVGYLDTRIAFGSGRVSLPVEQHVHSVLDMAPMIGLAWLVVSTWPAPIGDGWQLALRQPGLAAPLWWGVLAPAVLLTVLPALLEFRAAWRVRRAVRP